MKKTTLDKISESQRTTLYSISFEGVKSTKSYQEDPKLYGYVLDLQRFERILKENIEKGYISVNAKELIGTDNIIFEI
jgi:hypothetical protein